MILSDLHFLLHDSVMLLLIHCLVFASFGFCSVFILSDTKTDTETEKYRQIYTEPDARSVLYEHLQDILFCTTHFISVCIGLGLDSVNIIISPCSISEKRGPFTLNDSQHTSEIDTLREISSRSERQQSPQMFSGLNRGRLV